MLHDITAVRWGGYLSLAGGIRTSGANLAGKIIASTWLLLAALDSRAEPDLRFAKRFQMPGSSAVVVVRGLRAVAGASEVPLFMVNLVLDCEGAGQRIADRRRLLKRTACTWHASVPTGNGGLHLPKERERPAGRSPCVTQLLANSLARLQSALLSFWPSLRPPTGRVRLRRMPMPAV